jgi:hypothetical protein
VEEGEVGTGFSQCDLALADLLELPRPQEEVVVLEAGPR